MDTSQARLYKVRLFIFWKNAETELVAAVTPPGPSDLLRSPVQRLEVSQVFAAGKGVITAPFGRRLCHTRQRQNSENDQHDSSSSHGYPLGTERFTPQERPRQRPNQLMPAGNSRMMEGHQQGQIWQKRIM